MARLLTGYGDPVSAGLDAFGKVLGIADKIDELKERRADAPRKRELQDLQLQNERDVAAEREANKPILDANRNFQAQIISRKSRNLFDHNTATIAEGAVKKANSGEDLNPEEEDAILSVYMGTHPKTYNVKDIEDNTKDIDSLRSAMTQLSGPVLAKMSEPDFKGSAIARGQDLAGVKSDELLNTFGQVYRVADKFPGAKSATVEKLIIEPDASGQFKGMITPVISVVDNDGNQHSVPLTINGKKVTLPMEMFAKNIEAKKALAGAVNKVLINTGPEDISDRVKKAQHDSDQSEVKLKAENAVHVIQLKDVNASPSVLENEYKRTYLDEAKKVGFVPTEADMKLLDTDAKAYSAKANKVQHWHLGTVGGKRFGSKQGIMLNEDTGETKPVGGEYAEFANETKPEGSEKKPPEREVSEGGGVWHKEELVNGEWRQFGKSYGKGKEGEAKEAEGNKTPEQRQDEYDDYKEQRDKAVGKATHFWQGSDTKKDEEHKAGEKFDRDWKKDYGTLPTNPKVKRELTEKPEKSNGKKATEHDIDEAKDHYSKMTTPAEKKDYIKRLKDAGYSKDEVYEVIGAK
jgi:hypothetical protein